MRNEVEGKVTFPWKRILAYTVALAVIMLTVLILCYAIYHSVGFESGWNIVLIVWGVCYGILEIGYLILQIALFIKGKRDEK